MQTPLADFGAISGPLIAGLILGAISAGVGLLTATLNRPQGPVSDNTPPTLTDRGSPLPMLIGRRRIKGFLCWAGDRQVRKSGGGGKGLGGGGAGASQSYLEAGWHVLCVGPAARLNGIFENGKAIWTGDITPLDTPSGSHLKTKSGDAYIYWGEFNQPFNAALGSKLGTSSIWPCICYIWWNKHNHGNQVQWPMIEYELTVRIMDVVLSDSPAWLPEQTPGDLTDGPNPAHVLWQILTAPAPYGLGMSPDVLDGAGFESLGVMCADEHQSCHVLASGGINGTELIGQILADLGVMLPQFAGILTPVPIRHVDAADLPTVTDDMLVIPAPPPRQQSHAGALPDRLVFTIADRANNYRDMDIVIDDDSQAITRNRTKQQKINIPTVIDRRTALLVAKRREQEILTNPEKYTLDVTRGPRMMRSGQPFILNGYGQMRVATIEPHVGRRTARIEALIDQYSGEPGTYVPADIDDSYNTPQSAPADADLLVMAQEVPHAMSAEPAIAVLRVRANQQIAGATIWLSADGVSYTAIGSQDPPACGGTLQTALPAATLEIIEQGPVITAYNDDIQFVEDLSGNEPRWRTGATLAVIHGEIFFLRNVTAVMGGWRLDGLIRARYDTDAVFHGAGSAVAICAANDVAILKSPLIRANSTLYVKSQPKTVSEEADLSLVPAVAISVASPRALRPLPPDNFVVNRGLRINEFMSGSDIDFTWTYRVKDGAGRAADELGAGVAIGTGTPTREGQFRIRIRAIDMTLKREIVVDDDTGASIYSNADLTADFGSEPASFVAELANISGAYQSVTRLLTITQV